jgi:hypothetical protein
MLVLNNVLRNCARESQKLCWSVLAKNAASNFKFAKGAAVLGNIAVSLVWPPHEDVACEKKATQNGKVALVTDRTPAEKQLRKLWRNVDAAKNVAPLKIFRVIMPNRTARPLHFVQTQQTFKFFASNATRLSTLNLLSLFWLGIPTRNIICTSKLSVQLI